MLQHVQNELNICKKYRGGNGDEQVQRVHGEGEWAVPKIKNWIDWIGSPTP